MFPPLLLPLPTFYRPVHPCGTFSPCDTRVMATAPPGAARKLLPSVLLFHAGTHKQGTDEEERYTDADLKDIEANFKRFSTGPNAPLVAPVGKGHPDDGELWERSDLPAEGEVVRLWTEPVAINGREVLGLYCQLAVTPAVFNEVKEGKFRRVSAEIYPEPPEGLQGGRGKTLKRVALLGFEQPQLKHSGHLQTHAERVALRRGTGGVCWVYSEVQKMADATPDDVMMSSLKEAGYSEQLLSSLSPEQLALLFQDSQRIESGEGGPPAESAAAAAERQYQDPGMADLPDPATMSREDMIAELVSYGEDQTALEAMTDDDLRALLVQRRAEQGYSEEEPVATPNPTPAPAPVTPAARVPQKVTLSYSDAQALRRDMQRFRQELAAAQQANAARTRNDRAAATAAKRARVQAFCEQMAKEGRVLPCELDESDPRSLSLPQQLMELSDDVRRPAKTYSEGGRQIKLTALDAAMESIRRRPAQHFRERIASGTASQLAVSAERRKELLAHSNLGRAILRDEARKN